MCSSKQLTKDLNMMLIAAYNAGKGYKKISKHFQLTFSTVQDVMKKWQLKDTVEHKKTSEITAFSAGKKYKTNPHMKLTQEWWCSTNVMCMEESHLDKPETFWKQVLWTEEVKMELLGHNHQVYVGEKNKQLLIKRTPCQL